MIKVKNCPFCGSPAKQPEDVSVRKKNGEIDWQYGEWWQVMCGNEECRAWRSCSTAKKAAAKWNMRAEQPNVES